MDDQIESLQEEIRGLQKTVKPFKKELQFNPSHWDTGKPRVRKYSPLGEIRNPVSK